MILRVKHFAATVRFPGFPSGSFKTALQTAPNAPLPMTSWSTTRSTAISHSSTSTFSNSILTVCSWSGLNNHLIKLQWVPDIEKSDHEAIFRSIVCLQICTSKHAQLHAHARTGTFKRILPHFRQNSGKLMTKHFYSYVKCAQNTKIKLTNWTVGRFNLRSHVLHSELMSYHP